MDKYLKNIKEARDKIKELDVDLSKPIVIYFTTKNLSKEDKIIKKIILNEKITVNLFRSRSMIA